MTDIEFATLDPSNPAEVEEWWDVLVASSTHDLPDCPVPSRPVGVLTALHPTQFVSQEHLVARVAGATAANAALTWSHTDNRHLLEFGLDVHPRFRRRGVGTALLAEVERRARVDGRDTLVVYTQQGLPGGPPRSEAGGRFAERTGFTEGLREIHRRVDLTTVDESALDDRLAAGWEKADGYRLVQWIGEPSDRCLIEGMAYLDSRLVMDAPMGDLDLQPLSDDTDRMRARRSECATAASCRSTPVSGTSTVGVWWRGVRSWSTRTTRRTRSKR